MELSQNSNGYSRFNYTEVPSPIISPKAALTSPATGSAQRDPALQFTIPLGNTTFFREPTVLIKPNTPVGSNLAVAAWPSEVSNFVSGGGLTAATAAGSSLPATAPFAGGQTYSASSVTGTGPYVGVFIGRAPLQVWSSSSASYIPIQSLQGNFSTGSGASLTVRLQYQDPWGTYVTYNEVDPPILDGVPVNYLCTPENVFNVVEPFDPRTARFGMMQNDLGNPDATISATGVSQTDRARSSDAGRGVRQNDFGRGTPGAPGAINWSNPDPILLGNQSQVGQPAPGWFGANDGWNGTTGVPALVAQNDPAVTGVGTTNMFYADPDGVVRRATGAYMPSGTTDTGNPLKTGNDQSRPIILNRPFRSVAELGHVFRDTPWKNLDFFTPESADAGLLDVFCINDTDNSNQLMAGKVNLNTRQQPVLKAILASAFKDELNNLANPYYANSLAPVTAADADSIAKTVATWTQAHPLKNPAELIGSWSGTKTMISNISTYPDQTTKGYGIDGKLSYSGFTKQLTNAAFSTSQDPSWNIQRMHESATRALAAVGQTRVWNLMIDVVAQAGRYPPSATTAADLPKFVVDGEQRYWVHVAIDRFTGQVLDKQVEVVKE